MVLFAHVCGTRYFVSLLPLRRDLGNVGIRVSVAISGFLITTLLLQEFAASNTISLKMFNLRRTFRIFTLRLHVHSRHVSVVWQRFGGARAK